MSEQPNGPLAKDALVLDWFAGMAMQGLLSSRNLIGDDSVMWHEEHAESAYDLAAAMLAEREKRGIK